MEVDSYIVPPAGTSQLRAPRRTLRRVMFMLFIGGIAVALGVFFFLQLLADAPDSFPTDMPIEIPAGMGVREITSRLGNLNVVKSELFLYAVLVTYHNPTTIKASTYIFDAPVSVFEVARLLTIGDFDSDLIEFTHREGESAEDIAERAAIELTSFDTATFLRLAEGSEGKLFPETYRIPVTFTEAELYDKMRTTYEEKISPLRTKIADSGFSEHDVITLASIIEREANSPESMRLVAGILRNRITAGMYLQVDASIEYALDKPLSELTPEDLTSDSPYNTYTNPGLPPTPIGNPGMTAIMSVLEPEPSDYFFYITDETGTFHYARTFDEHKINIARYLR